MNVVLLIWCVLELVCNFKHQQNQALIVKNLNQIEREAYSTNCDEGKEEKSYSPT